MSKKRTAKKMKIFAILIISILISVLSIRAYNSYRFHIEKQTRFMMDTYVTIHVIGPEKITRPAVNAALDRMQQIAKKMNPNNPKSELNKFNSQGIPIRDPEILDLVKIALDISIVTEGVFDITAFPLSELWGFSRFSETTPQCNDRTFKISWIFRSHNNGKMII